VFVRDDMKEKVWPGVLRPSRSMGAADQGSIFSCRGATTVPNKTPRAVLLLHLVLMSA
jgi:hypothetical protein